MKHIKTYKLFESSNINDIRNDINDILLELKDDDDTIRVVIQELPHNTNRLSIEIYYNEDIYDINQKDMILDTNKYKDELLRLNDYLEMNGYEFSTYNYPGVSNDEITNDFNKIFEIKPINSITLYYK
jgi:hypothetical protein